LASIGTSTRKILTEPTEPLQRLLQQLIVNNEGDEEILPAFGISATASQAITGLGLIEPPADQTDSEWIVQGIVVVDTANVDKADKVSFVYLDLVANVAFGFFCQSASLNIATTFNQWTWPTTIPPPTATTSDVNAGYIPFRLFRKVNGEAWRRIRVDVLTTATVGTRNFKAQVVFRRRPSTRI
jgi:hypothetical protein